MVSMLAAWMPRWGRCRKAFLPSQSCCGNEGFAASATRSMHSSPVWKSSSWLHARKRSYRHGSQNSLLHIAGPFLIFFTLLIVHTLNPFLASTFCKRNVYAEQVVCRFVKPIPSEDWSPLTTHRGKGSVGRDSQEALICAFHLASTRYLPDVCKNLV